MLNLLGEYDCKLDAKGRFLLPKGIKKKLDGHLSEVFVIKKDLSCKALVIYPWESWEKETAMLNKLNLFKGKNREFVRRFNNGLHEMQLDGQGRFLIPGGLLAFAEANKEVKLLALNNRIEFWSRENYEQMLAEDVDVGELGEEVMGDIEPDFD